MFATQFVKRAGSYDSQAFVQQFMARYLIALLRDFTSLQDDENLADIFSNVFEFGCAQGQYTRLLLENFAPKKLLCNDINDYKKVFENPPFSDFDVEFARFDMNNCAKILTQQFSCITSNACLQWLDQREALARLQAFLRSQGLLAFSTFGKRNLWQVRELCNVGLEYLDLEEYRTLMELECEILHLSTQTKILHFNSALEVFKHLALSGVNGLQKGFFLKKALLQEYAKRYDNNLEYECVFVLARKKPIPFE
ncbi:methyltransferase domain-containing protein [Helicobacter himalayensis]|uniref:methyltransferase domain-containing protein n=1 Tax=Helicobacter himalayensis TaxID=1591088 RepID=UPI003D6F0D74